MSSSLYDKGTTLDRTSGKLWIQKPAATPSGFQDYQIDPDDFLSSEQARLDQAEADIIDIDDRLTTVETQFLKLVYLARVVNFNLSINNGDIITKVLLTSTQAATDLIIKAGTSAGGSDVFSQRTIPYGEGLVIQLNKPFWATSTVYITITQGRANVTVWKDINNV